MKNSRNWTFEIWFWSYSYTSTRFKKPRLQVSALTRSYHNSPQHTPEF